MSGHCFLLPSVSVPGSCCNGTRWRSILSLTPCCLIARIHLFSLLRGFMALPGPINYMAVIGPSRRKGQNEVIDSSPNLTALGFQLLSLLMGFPPSPCPEHKSQAVCVRVSSWIQAGQLLDLNENGLRDGRSPQTLNRYPVICSMSASLMSDVLFIPCLLERWPPQDTQRDTFAIGP